MKNYSLLFFFSFLVGACYLLAPSLSFNQESLADQMIEVGLDSDDETICNIPSLDKELDSLIEEEVVFSFKFKVTKSLKDPDLFNIELNPLPPKRNSCRIVRERFSDPLINLFGMRFDYKDDDSSEKITLEIIEVSLESKFFSDQDFLCSGLINCRISGDCFLLVKPLANRILIEEDFSFSKIKSFMSEDGKEMVRCAVVKGVEASKVGLWFSCCFASTMRDLAITALESTKSR